VRRPNTIVSAPTMFPEVRLRELFVRHDPVEPSVFGGEVAARADVIESDDSSHLKDRASRLMRWFEKLDRVAVGIVDLNLAASWT
jgi:hypothetical protein